MNICDIIITRKPKWRGIFIVHNLMDGSLWSTAMIFLRHVELVFNCFFYKKKKRDNRIEKQGTEVKNMDKIDSVFQFYLKSTFEPPIFFIY